MLFEPVSYTFRRELSASPEILHLAGKQFQSRAAAGVKISMIRFGCRIHRDHYLLIRRCSFKNKLAVGQQYFSVASLCKCMIFFVCRNGFFDETSSAR
jgi:hypothetical protein